MNDQLDSIAASVVVLITHPITTALGLLVGLWGLVVTLKSTRRVRGYFSSSYTNWFRDATNHDGLSISYRGKTINQIGASEVAFWNGGNQTVRYEDFSKQLTLALDIQESIQIFELEVVKKVPPSLSVTIGDVSSAVRDGGFVRVPVVFEFLEPNEGFRIKAVHDGGPQADIHISGRLAGAGGVERVTIGGFTPLMRSSTEKFFVFQGLLFLTVLGIFCINQILKSDWSWYHGIGATFITYSVLLPGVLMAKIAPKGLG